MTFLAANEREQRGTLQVGAMGPGTFEIGGPAAFEGFGTATAQAFGRAAATVGGFAYELGKMTPGYRLQKEVADLFGKGDALEGLEAIGDQAVRDAIDYYRPDPQTTGWAGQVSYGALSVLLPAAAGSVAGPLGAAALAGGAVGTGTFYDMTGEGVDRRTALGAAGIDAAVTAAGVFMPAALGSRLATQVLTGAGLNVGLGMGQRYAMGEYMRGAGYAEIASRYEVMDTQAIFTDAIIGAGAGALPAAVRAVFGREDVPQSVVDAVMVQNQVRHAELDTAPGIPANAAAMNAHVRATDATTAQLLNGQPADVESIVRGAEFAPRPRIDVPEVAAIEAELRDLGYADLLDEIGGLEAQAAARGLAPDAEVLPAMPERAPVSESAQVVVDVPPADPDIPPNALHPRSDLGRFIQQMRAEIGWEERGGRIIRGGEINNDMTAGADFGRASGEVVGRTSWVPKARVDGQGESRMWSERPVKITEAEARRAVDKFAAGEKLTKRERGFIEYMGQTARQYDAERAADAAEREAADIGADIDRRAAERDEMMALAEEDAVAQIVADKPDMELPGGTTAADAIAAADETVDRATIDSAGYQAAVNCFLRNG